MTTHVSESRSRGYTKRAVAALAFCIALAIIMPALFLPSQSLWVDETTQLSGLTLGPVEVAKWLSGNDGHRFGVPPDRAPPMSYWVGRTWASLFGLTELSMRWMGIVLVTLAVGLVFDAAFRVWGAGAALASGLLMALSPNVVVNAVEIRSYPLFLLVSASACWFLVRWIGNGQGRGFWLAGLFASSAVAAMTHFFGLLLAGAAMTGAFVGGLIARRRIRWVFLGGPVLALALFGLQPFIRAATELSGVKDAIASPGVGELARYAYRSLYGHPALGTSLIVLGAGTLAFLTLTILSLLRRRHSTEIAIALVATLLSGMAVAVAASYMVTTFDGLHPSYNIWRTPFLAVLFGSCVGLNWRPARRAAIVCAAVLIGAEAFASVQLIRHGDWFSHGPGARVERLINETGAANVAVVHDGAFQWGQGYYPLHYRYGASLAQFADEDLGSGVRLRRLPQGEIIHLNNAPGERVIVIEMKDVGWSELTDALREGGRPFAGGAALEWFRASPDWRLLRHEVYYSMFAADVHVFERQRDQAP